MLGPVDLGGAGLFRPLRGGWFLMLMGISLNLGLPSVVLFIEANPMALQQDMQRLLLSCQ